MYAHDVHRLAETYNLPLHEILELIMRHLTSSLNELVEEDIGLNQECLGERLSIMTQDSEQIPDHHVKAYEDFNPDVEKDQVKRREEELRALIEPRSQEGEVSEDSDPIDEPDTIQNMLRDAAMQESRGTEHQRSQMQEPDESEGIWPSPYSQRGMYWREEDVARNVAQSRSPLRIPRAMRLENTRRSQYQYPDFYHLPPLNQGPGSIRHARVGVPMDDSSIEDIRNQSNHLLFEEEEHEPPSALGTQDGVNSLDSETEYLVPRVVFEDRSIPTHWIPTAVILNNHLYQRAI